MTKISTKKQFIISIFVELIRDYDEMFVPVHDYWVDIVQCEDEIQINHYADEDQEIDIDWGWGIDISDLEEINNAEELEQKFQEKAEFMYDLVFNLVQ